MLGELLGRLCSQDCTSVEVHIQLLLLAGLSDLSRSRLSCHKEV